MDRELAYEEARLWNGEVIEWSAARDRALPTAKSHAHGYGVRFINPHTSETTIMLGISALGMFRRKHGLIVDDGQTARPFYATGRGRSRSGKVFVRRYVPFPVNEGGRKLTDAGDEFDSAVWLLGPYTYHHIKVHALESGRQQVILPPDHRKSRPRNES
jgi:hypothetical protein